MTTAITLDQKTEQIEQIAKSFGGSGESIIKSVMGQLKLARAMTQLEKLLDDEFMMEVLPLMNSPLGFLTDRDPSKPGKNGKTDPYSVDVVRRCLMEATLRGVSFAGNEMNIIASRMYITKAGYARKLREFPGLTNYAENFAAPRMTSEVALVRCKATWKLNGQADSLECEIPVKTHGMGEDAAIGKAERKLRARVFTRISGSYQEEFEPEDEQPATAPKIVEQVSPSITVIDQGNRVEAEAAHAAAEAPQESPREFTEDEQLAEYTRLGDAFCECKTLEEIDLVSAQVVKAIESGLITQQARDSLLEIRLENKSRVRSQVAQ